MILIFSYLQFFHLNMFFSASDALFRKKCHLLPNTLLITLSWMWKTRHQKKGFDRCRRRIRSARRLSFLIIRLVFFAWRLKWADLASLYWFADLFSCLSIWRSAFRIARDFEEAHEPNSNTRANRQATTCIFFFMICYFDGKCNKFSRVRYVFEKKSVSLLPWKYTKHTY